MKATIQCFSPTRGGEKVAKAIQRGLESDEPSDFMPVIFAIPVYGGHMPEAARQALGDVRGSGKQPAILVAVYGNRPSSTP